MVGVSPLPLAPVGSQWTCLEQIRVSRCSREAEATPREKGTELGLPLALRRSFLPF